MRHARAAILRGGLLGAVAVVAIWSAISGAAVGAPGIGGLPSVSAALTEEALGLAGGPAVVARGRLAVSVFRAPAAGSPAVGQPVTYLVRVRNTGARTASAVQATVRFPAGFTPAAQLPANCVLAPAAAPGGGSSFNCALGSLGRSSTARAAQAGATLRFSGSLTTPGEHRVSATASSRLSDSSTVAFAMGENTVVVSPSGEVIWLGNNVDDDGGGDDDNDDNRRRGRNRGDGDDDTGDDDTGDDDTGDDDTGDDDTG